MKKIAILVCASALCFCILACSSGSAYRSSDKVADSTVVEDVVTTIEVDLTPTFTNMSGSDYMPAYEAMEFDRYGLNYTPAYFYKLKMDGRDIGIYKEDELAVAVREIAGPTFVYNDGTVDFSLIEADNGVKYILTKPADICTPALLNESEIEVTGEYVGVSLSEIAGKLEVPEDEAYSKLKEGVLPAEDVLFTEIRLICNVVSDWADFKSNPKRYAEGFDILLSREYVDGVISEIVAKEKQEMIDAGAVLVTLSSVEYYASEKELSGEQLDILKQLGDVSPFEEQIYTDENGEIQTGMGYMISHYAFEDGIPAFLYEDESAIGPCFKSENGTLYELVESEVVDANVNYWVMESSVFKTYLENLSQESGW